MPKRSSNKKIEIITLVKSIEDRAAGAVPPEPLAKNSAAVELGRLGGLKGGRARAEKLSAAERQEIARKAARARWHLHG